ncbi:MAG: hypothetical protein J5637_07940 [Prevotella sp.]|nr:hypothetical protein [Prevotella sp.]
MKSLLLFFSFLFSLHVSCQDWSEHNIKGDDLKGTSDSKAYVFTDGAYHFMFWDNEDNTFRLFLDKDQGFFNYSSLIGKQGYHIVLGLVGFYDNSDKLVDKIENFCLELDDDGMPNSAHPNRYTRMGGNNNKNVRKILNYITNSKGYVRFVYELYGGGEFDFRVRCMK